MLIMIARHPTYSVFSMLGRQCWIKEIDFVHALLHVCRKCYSPVTENLNVRQERTVLIGSKVLTSDLL